jgi:hypothetical protein
MALELLTSDEPTPVRTLTRAALVSVAAAHATLGELAGSGLVTDGQARHPDLFWAVADRWPPRSAPRPGFVAVPPTSHATTDRVESSGDWPRARPLVVAIHLASNSRPRSPEILDGWTPPPQELRHVR